MNKMLGNGMLTSNHFRNVDTTVLLFEKTSQTTMWSCSVLT